MYNIFFIWKYLYFFGEIDSNNYRFRIGPIRTYSLHFLFLSTIELQSIHVM
jgi:hypothetical protein